MRSLWCILLIIIASCTEIENSNQVQNDKNGMAVEYYSNGQIKIQGHLDHGVREGKWESFFEDGKRWSESTYKEGTLHGPTKAYYSNGTLMYTGKFIEGSREGQWVFYKEDGTIDYKIDY